MVEPGSDQDHYNLGAIRQLLLAAFTAEELRRFCQDRPTFQPTLVKFGPKYNLEDMVDEVLFYCESRDLLDEIVTAVREINPRQYAHLEDLLYGPSYTLHRTESAQRFRPPEPKSSVNSFVQGIKALKEEFDSKVRRCYSRHNRNIVQMYGVHPGETAFRAWKERYIIFLMENNLRREVDRFRQNTELGPDPLVAQSSSARRAFEDAWGKYVDAQIGRLMEDAQEGLLDRYLMRTGSSIEGEG